jgi:two-component system response regulator VicR
MKRILVIEDDAQLRLGLKDNLEVEGYHVLTAVDGESGVRAVTTEHPDVVVLDVLLPAMNGFDVCRAIRARGITTPVLMLTARGHETDKVLGLELGADDYVTKPFSIQELLARIRALLRRAAGQSGIGETFRFGDVEIHFVRELAWRGGKPLSLSTLEFEALRYLIRRRGEVVSRDQLLGDVWGYKSFPTTRSVDNLMVRLRQKLETNPHNPRHLLTVHGSGYKFVE